MSNIVAFLFVVAGLLGALPVNSRIAWVLVAIAGLAMVFPL